MFVRLLILVTFCAYSEGRERKYPDTHSGAGTPVLKSRHGHIDSNPEPGFRFDYTYIEEAKGWFKLHFSPMTWEDAKLQCYYEGAVLASPLSDNLVLGLKMLWRKQKMCPTVMYSGVHSLFAPGIYTSIEGVPLERMSIYWDIDEPAYIRNGCLVFFSNGTMASKSCSDQLPFVCYKKQSDLAKTECGTADTEYQRVNPETNTQSCYKCHSQAEEWSKAFAICQAEGAFLAIINSTKADELKDWKLRILQTKDIFIGYKNIRGTWWDIHDTGKTCAQLLWGGEFVSTYCDTKLSFICEKTIDSLL